MKTTWRDLYYQLLGIAAGAGIICNYNRDRFSYYGYAFHVKQQPSWILGQITIVRVFHSYRDKSFLLGHELGHLIRLDHRSQDQIIVIEPLDSPANEKEATDFIIDVINTMKVQRTEKDNKKLAKLVKLSSKRWPNGAFKRAKKEERYVGIIC